MPLTKASVNKIAAKLHEMSNTVNNVLRVFLKILRLAKRAIIAF
jgi:hypothetical protein